jgi:hypothetical protein
MRWTEPATHRPILIGGGLALGFVVAFSIGARRYLRKQRQTSAAAQRLATELTDPRPGS